MIFFRKILFPFLFLFYLYYSRELLAYIVLLKQVVAINFKFAGLNLRVLY